MPFIEEEKFSLMQQDFDNAKLKREEAEKEVNIVNEEFDDYKKKSKRTSVLLGILLGPALALATMYIYASNNKVEVEESTGRLLSKKELITIKTIEAKRVLDSVKEAQAILATTTTIVEETPEPQSGLIAEDVENVATDVSDNISDEPIYSVQIGVFSQKKYPLMSSKTIPTTVTPKDGYFKYSIGLFSTLNEAKYLKKELKKIGFRDAFVASYINGERQKIHQ